jgi:hypothetical protein
VVVRTPVSLSAEGRTVTAITAVVNEQGGLVLSPQDFRQGSEVKLKHLDSKKTALCRVVWNGGLDELGSYKIGLEFVDGAEGFWGADLHARS